MINFKYKFKNYCYVKYISWIICTSQRLQKA